MKGGVNKLDLGRRRLIENRCCGQNDEGEVFRQEQEQEINPRCGWDFLKTLTREVEAEAWMMVKILVEDCDTSRCLLVKA